MQPRSEQSVDYPVGGFDAGHRLSRSDFGKYGIRHLKNSSPVGLAVGRQLAVVKQVCVYGISFFG